MKEILKSLTGLLQSMVNNQLTILKIIRRMDKAIKRLETKP